MRENRDILGVIYMKIETSRCHILENRDVIGVI